MKPAPTSWGALYDKKFKGKITVPNNPIQIADAALYLGRRSRASGSPIRTSSTKKQFDAAVALLKQQRPLVKKYWDSPTDEINLFKSGDATLGASWPYQTLALQAAKAPVKEMIPREGATGWADTWMLAKKAPHPNCAYLWMRYVSTPPVQAQQALFFGETPVNPKACPFMNKLQKGSCSQYHLDAPLSYYKTIHFWKTPVADCGNGKKDCLDYNAWQRAWTRDHGLTDGVARSRQRARPSAGPARLSAALWRRPWLKGSGCSRRPLLAFLARLPRVARRPFISAFWTVDSFTGKLIHAWTLDNFRTLFSTRPHVPPHRRRTIGIAAAVTLTDAVLAFPLAYFMARIAAAGSARSSSSSSCCRSGRATSCASTRGG